MVSWFNPEDPFDLDVMVLTGCEREEFAPILQGIYYVAGQYHGKAFFKRAGKADEREVYIHYWDERDGDDFCGWWICASLGSPWTWAFHQGKAADLPPPTNWKIPFDGEVDKTMTIEHMDFLHFPRLA